MRTTDRRAQVCRFRRSLLRWFRRHGRDLPWRRTRDPYRIVVSEFMLQQTQVSRVAVYYAGFLARYPTLESLAAASPTSVRESWEGLGYYRRATNLQRLAQEVVRDRGGLIPSDPEELRRLPGVGRYTAGAIASFAFERAVPAVDTNVARVLQRAFYPRSRGKTITQRLWELAALLVPTQAKNAWAFNQAIMELGALVCTARVARCGACPVRKHCAMGKRREAVTAALPRRTKRPARTSPRSTPRCAAASAARRSSAQPHRSDRADPAGSPWEGL
jgi:A/G-specific adenine glycosylase